MPLFSQKAVLWCLPFSVSQTGSFRVLAAYLPPDGGFSRAHEQQFPCGCTVNNTICATIDLVVLYDTLIGYSAAIDLVVLDDTLIGYSAAIDVTVPDVVVINVTCSTFGQSRLL